MAGASFRDRHPLLYAAGQVPREWTYAIAILVALALVFLWAYLLVLKIERDFFGS